jgi:WD40 repeat protein/tetratricopeptide (TPR) repeat protein/tRNA A-37 threonylcarbamoyl transferase component Bud32
MPSDTPETSPLEERFEEVLTQILQAEEQGQTPDLQPFLERYPDLETPLRSFFRNREGFARLAPLVAPTPLAGGAGTASTADTVTSPNPPPARPAPVLTAGSRFGGYEILEELGRGGMGIVYRARQLVPQREVALKVIRTDRLAELPEEERRQWIERFHREAQLVATLDQQAHIVTLYEVGEHEGQPYFTMRLLTGGSLAHRLETADGTNPAAAPDRRVRDQRAHAELLAKVARAVDYAHRRGILHRDLKPANILLDAADEPLVSDFGLARRLDQTGSLVASGIVGTASYMPPEQAATSPGAATTAADVYSLGAMLYELLTGQPPFRGKSEFETLLLVLQRAPVPPRQLNRRLSRDLETICLKCLEKEPTRRYRSAVELADDLDNWGAGRPINARPASTAERIWRWCKRNPVPAVAAALMLATVAIAFALISLSRNEALELAEHNAWLAQRNEDLGVAERRQKEIALGQAKENAALARKYYLLGLEERAQRQAAQRADATRTLHEAVTQCETPGGLGRGLLGMTQALEIARRAEASDLEWAIRANLAAWSRPVPPVRLFFSHGRPMHAVAASADGSTVVTGGYLPDETDRLGLKGRGIARIWDGNSGQPRSQPLLHEGQVQVVAVSPNGRMVLTADLAAGLRGTAQLWDARTGQKVGPPFQHCAGSSAIAFRPDGKLLVTGSTDRTAQLWDPVTRKAVGQPMRHDHLITSVAFSPDGRTLLTGSWDRTARLWDGATGQPRGKPLAHQISVERVAFSPDGRLFVTAGTEFIPLPGRPRPAEVHLWDATTGQKLPQVLKIEGFLGALRFSPDSRLIATGDGDRTAQLWEASTGRPVGPSLQHGDRVGVLAFSPDGETLLTASGNGAARVWDTRTGQPLSPFFLHPDGVIWAAFSPDARTVRTACRDGSVWLRDATTIRPLGWRIMMAGNATCCRFSPDGRTLLVGHSAGGLLLDTATGRQIGGALGSSGLVSGVGFSADGRTAVTGGLSGIVQLWDVATGRPKGQPLKHRERIMQVALSSDGRTVAAARDGKHGLRGGVQLWDAVTGRPGLDLPHPGRVWAVAFSPDRKTLLTGGLDGTVRLWDTATGKARLAPLVHPHGVWAAAFSPDGRTILTGCGQPAAPQGEGRLWDTRTGRLLGRPMSHKGLVRQVAFRKDGRAVLTASMDRTARVWNATDGSPLGPALRHDGTVLTAAFSPDGRMVLTGGAGGTRLWEPRTGRQIGARIPNSQGVECVAFSPDGRRFFMGGADGLAECRETPVPWTTPVDQLTSWMEVITGQKRDADGVVRWLAPEAWQAARQKLPKPGRLPLSPIEPAAWHRTQAEQCEQKGRWFATIFHLNFLVDEKGPDRWLLHTRRGRAHAQLGQWEKAIADLTKAIKGKPGDWRAWYVRGYAYIGLRRWDKATADLTESLKLKPGNGSALAFRGLARAELGQWEEAARDYAKAAQTERTLDLWRDYAMVCLARGDDEGYRDICKRLLEFLNKQFDAEAAILVTWLCVLAPDAVADFAPVLNLAQKGVGKKPITQYVPARTLGAALVRAGKYPQGVKQLEAALTLRKDPSPTVWLFLAMAQHHSQRPEEAKKWLAKARAWIAQTRKTKPDRKDVLTWDRIPWTERLALEELQREAEKLIEGKSSKP